MSIEIIEPKFLMTAVDIRKIVKQCVLNSLPSSLSGIRMRASSEDWPTMATKGKGGPGGVLILYLLPQYAVDEIRSKGFYDLLLPFIYYPEEEVNLHEKAKITNGTTVIANYADWARKQNKEEIIPIQYYKSTWASAGNGIIPFEEEPKAIWFRRYFFNYLGVNPASCICIRIRGDSMYPILKPDGTALFYLENEYKGEYIYLFRQGKDLKVKRLQRNGHIMRIISDNKEIYPPIDLDLSQLHENEFQIIGRYLWDCGISK